MSTTSHSWSCHRPPLALRSLWPRVKGPAQQRHSPWLAGHKEPYSPWLDGHKEPRPLLTSRDYCPLFGLTSQRQPALSWPLTQRDRRWGVGRSRGRCCCVSGFPQKEHLSAHDSQIGYLAPLQLLSGFCRNRSAWDTRWIHDPCSEDPPDKTIRIRPATWIRCLLNSIQQTLPSQASLEGRENCKLQR